MSGMWTIRVTGASRSTLSFTNLYSTTQGALQDAEKFVRYTLEQWRVPCERKIEWVQE